MLFANSRQSEMTPRNFWCPFTSYFHYPSAPAFFSSFAHPSLWVPCFLLLSIYLLRFIIVLFFLQATETDFSNVGTMIECGFFIEALDSIRSAVFPGLLPPASYLLSLLEYAQQVGPELPDCRNSHLLLHEPQGLHESIMHFITFFLSFGSYVFPFFFWHHWTKLCFDILTIHPNLSNVICCVLIMSQGNATSVFLRNFLQVMYNLLVTNPPWLAPSTVKRYFTQVLQCPRCKTGLWPFLETAIR